MTDKAPVLDVQGLRTAFHLPERRIVAVDDVSLCLHKGETLALVGESGSGKSVTCLTIMRLLSAKVGHIEAGTLRFCGKHGESHDLAQLDDEAMRRIRGHDIAMVFQEPMTSLNPVYTIGDQIAEPMQIHLNLGRSQAFDRAIELLKTVGIPDPAKRARQYPHELSGGMRQRATIAMALACSPSLLIADEPTTALDVTIQAQILMLLKELQQSNGMAMLFVTHNLGVVAQIADRVAVMYAGRIVETGLVADIFARPSHPYTQGLLHSMPRLGSATALKKSGKPLFAIAGMVPSLADLPQGCAFAPRCTFATEECRASRPALFEVAEGHFSRCFHANEVCP